MHVQPGTPFHGIKRTRQPKWRELTDEQRWERIYADRKTKSALNIDDVHEATKLALPAYAMHFAIVNCHAKGNATIRPDAHKATVAAIATVASRLVAHRRDSFGERLERRFSLIRSNGFFTDNREFLYAVSAATLKLVDEFLYPADSPASMAALVFVEDAHHDDNDWGLSETHAAKARDWVFDSFIASDLYKKLS